MVEVAYKSTHPLVLDNLRNYEIDRQIFIDTTDAIAALAGEGWAPLRLVSGFDARMVGLIPQDSLAPDGPWRRTSIDGFAAWVPAQRYRRGKEIAVEMDSRKLRPLREYLVGMPHLVITDGHWWRPSVFCEETPSGRLKAAWVGWGVRPDSGISFSEADRVDTEYWQEKPLSAYYKVYEQRNERLKSNA